MNAADIAMMRMRNQMLAEPIPSTVTEVVAKMGALQAQDYAMSKLAIGLRTPGSTEKEIEAALSSGSLARTHLLRPTWHIAAAAGLRALLRLSAPNIKASMRSRNRQLGLTDELFAISDAVIEKEFERKALLKRKELIAALEENKIDTADNRASHLLMNAELNGLICSGPLAGRDPVYRLFADVVPAAEPVEKEVALRDLTRTYFQSRGPAALSDFIWWSGLSVKDAKKGLALAEAEFESAEVDGKTYYFRGGVPDARGSAPAFHFLPAFDEYLLSYADRSAVLDGGNFDRVISKNGIFWPAIVFNGKVIGIWKRSVGKETVEIEMEFFGVPPKAVFETARAAASLMEPFFGKPIVLKGIGGSK